MHRNKVITIFSNLFWLPFFSGFVKLSSAADSNLHSKHFIIHQNTSLPSSADSLVYKTLPAINKLHCVTLCTRDIACVSFYAFPKESSLSLAVKKWECRFMKMNIETQDLLQGNGFYGSFKWSLGVTPPKYALKDGEFEGFAVTPHGVAAVYDCSSSDLKMTNIALLYHYENDEWPDLNNACSLSICNQLGLAGTLLRITKNYQDPNGHYLDPLCRDDEYRFSDIVCTGDGSWSYIGNGGTPEAGCVSTTCTKNAQGRGVYKGTMSSPDGVTACQEWRLESPRAHGIGSEFFYEDGFDKVNAKNYCRDPDGTGGPWCYRVAGDRWGSCILPRCRLSYTILN